MHPERLTLRLSILTTSMEKARLTESQIRRIIYEELVDHYLVQHELWDDERTQAEKSPSRQMNNDGQKA
jgi:hypothetical protein